MVCFPGTHPNPSNTVWYAVNMSAFTSSCFTILTLHLCLLLLSHQELLISRTPQCEISVLFCSLYLESTVQVKFPRCLPFLTWKKTWCWTGFCSSDSWRSLNDLVLLWVSQTSTFIIITLLLQSLHIFDKQLYWLDFQQLHSNLKYCVKRGFVHHLLYSLMCQLCNSSELLCITSWF